MRRIGSWFFTYLLMLVTGQIVYDSTSGFRAVDRNLIRYFAENYPQDYPEVEVIAALSKRGIKFIEIPVEMYQRKNGKSSINFHKSIYYMIKVSLAVILTPLKSKKNMGI
ncbi:MAG: hypothetical protein QME35_00750 [Thermoanaerobacteraceae bacterium]|nr:hypothetical protein [Thermoanaerobacteraceae bacterium]